MKWLWNTLGCSSSLDEGLIGLGETLPVAGEAEEPGILGMMLDVTIPVPLEWSRWGKITQIIPKNVVLMRFQGR